MIGPAFLHILAPSALHYPAMVDPDAMSPEVLSDLIGAIYDCAIDPDRWEGTLDSIRDLLDCANGVLFVSDLPRAEHRIQKAVGFAPDWLARFPAYQKDLTELANAFPPAVRQATDEPYTALRDADPAVVRTNRYYLEWALPQGLIDSFQLTLIASGDRFGSVGFGRHERFGPIGEREVRTLRGLAPHLRRAVTIADLLDMRAVRSRAYEAALAGLAVGVFLVSAEGRIVHANRAAEIMLRAGTHLKSFGGRLAAVDRVTAASLSDAIACTARSDEAIGSAGIGVALHSRRRRPLVAYVLPLGHSAARARLAEHAAAAVFVSDSRKRSVAVSAAFAGAYGLTDAETRLLERVLGGGSLGDAARVLGISQNTAKTQLAHIFAKTGVHRRSELVALVDRLAPPVNPG